MSLSDSSSLSSPPSSDNEEEPPLPAPPPPPKTLKLKGGKLTAASGEASAPSSPEPEPPAREPSPPHEYVLADNPDIAFLVMFRARFSEVFPKNVPNLGPQDIERGVVETTPSEQIENFLCALLGLVLNRKKYVERGHYGRALEEAISTHKSQWPRSWQNTNPLPGTKTFADLDPTERLSLLKTLVLWALSASDAVSGIIKESYKQSRHETDLNQPLAVQLWGSDDRKRRYWLIEGQTDTPFRLYRESAPRIVNKTWWSVAGTIDELKAVGEGLAKEHTQAARRLADSITQSIPRLEETQEKRKRKEYRQSRRAAFLRPEPGYSLYEGRTRGKKMKYTFSDDEDFSESSSVRRSTRQSNGSTPAEPNGPTVTSSGRQIRSRFGRSYGDPLVQSREGTAGVESSEAGDPDATGSFTRADGRPQRSTARGYQKKSRNGYSTDDELGDDADDDSNPSEGEWHGDDDDVEGKLDHDEEDEDSDSASDDSMMEVQSSLVVTLRYKKSLSKSSNQERVANGGKQVAAEDQIMHESTSRPLLQSPTIAHRPKLGPSGDFPDSSPREDHGSLPPVLLQNGDTSMPPLAQPNQISKHQINGLSSHWEDQPMDSAVSLPDISSSPSSTNQYQPPLPVHKSPPPLWQHRAPIAPEDAHNTSQQRKLPSIQNLINDPEPSTRELVENGHTQYQGQTYQNNPPQPHNWQPDTSLMGDVPQSQLFQHNSIPVSGPSQALGGGQDMGNRE